MPLPAPLYRHHRLTLKKSKSKGSTTTGGVGSYDHPPPVIALSRSSFSIGSSSSTESALETTEVDRYQDEEKRSKGKKKKKKQTDLGAVRFWLKGRGHRHGGEGNGASFNEKDSSNGWTSAVASDTDLIKTMLHGESKDTLSDMDRAMVTSSLNMDFAARHELLLNALFEDALHRHEQQIGGAAGGLDGTALSASATNLTKGEASSSSSLRPLLTPPRPTRKSSVGTIGDTPGGATSISGYSKSSLSKSSRISSSTTGSDLLNPSCHQFTNKLQKTKRKCQHRTLCAIKQRKSKTNRSSNHSFRKYQYACASSVEGNGSYALKRGGKEEASVTSSTTLSQDTKRSSSAGELARSFLHPVCRLQKDSGKGVDPGTAISVSGREEAVKKLMEKMDLLAEVEQDGAYTNAVLTRIQAKNITLAKSEVNGGSDALWERGFVETRSMLAVKMGFVSLRYGIMIHWNRQTGLAELIVLRKLCPDSFMKVKMESKSKSWKKRMRRMSAISASAVEETKISVSS